MASGITSAAATLPPLVCSCSEPNGSSTTTGGLSKYVGALLGTRLEALLERVDPVERAAVRRRVVGRRARDVAEHRSAAE